MGDEQGGVRQPAFVLGAVTDHETHCRLCRTIACGVVNPGGHAGDGSAHLTGRAEQNVDKVPLNHDRRPSAVSLVEESLHCSVTSLLLQQHDVRCLARTPGLVKPSIWLPIRSAVCLEAIA